MRATVSRFESRGEEKNDSRAYFFRERFCEEKSVKLKKFENIMTRQNI